MRTELSQIYKSRKSCRDNATLFRGAAGRVRCFLARHHDLRNGDRHDRLRRPDPRPDRPLRRHRAALCAGGGRAAARLGRRSSTASPAAAPTGSGSCSTSEDYVNALGAVTGNQAMQMVRAGLKAIYLSGWQVAADANTAGAMYPDQSLYPANAGPELCRRINRTLQRADQIEHMEGGVDARLVRADRRRCRGRLRRAAQLLRDHEGLYRGGRRRRPFRGPARRPRRSAAISAARC